MAQSLITLPSETVFAECRAFVFFYDIQLNRWSEVAEPNVYSRIQLLCSRPPGSTGSYRILGRLETTGMVRCITNWLSAWSYSHSHHIVIATCFRPGAEVEESNLSNQEMIELYYNILAFSLISFVASLLFSLLLCYQGRGWMLLFDEVKLKLIHRYVVQLVNVN